MNGGAASYVLGNDEEKAYNDFDLIFGAELGREDGTERVKHAVLSTLLQFFPTTVGEDGVNLAKPTLNQLEDVYFHKVVKVSTESDRWSLVSLCNSRGTM